MRFITKRQAGFSLAEFAVILLVVGLVGGMSMSTGQTIVKAGGINATKTQLVSIRDALHLFKKKHGRYPCPARENDVMSSATYGVEVSDCANTVTAGVVKDAFVAIGMTPYKSLGLNQSIAIDDWGNKITYAIDVNHTVSSTIGGGSLMIVDVNGNSLTQSPTMGKVIFALVSHGEDGSGAYADDGDVRQACDLSAKDSENCDDDWAFMDASATQSNISVKYFDDYVLWYAQGGETTTLPKVNMVSNYFATTCGIKPDNRLSCWGDNTNGQIGDGTTANKNTPTGVQGGGTWKTVAVAEDHACGIRFDDTLWCWGNGVNAPVQESQHLYWQSVAVAGTNSCAVDSNDNLYCWTSVVSGFTPILQQNSVNLYGLGLTHQCFINSVGQLFCWGTNDRGQAGSGNGNIGTNVLFPTEVVGGGTWIKLSVAAKNSCGIKTDNTLWCWGYNTDAQAGSQDYVDEYGLIDVGQPTQVFLGGTWKDVVVGATHSCGIKTDNSLWCWGDPTNGQVGSGVDISDGSGHFRQVAGGDLWKKVSVGYDSTCGIKTDNTLWCWGRNNWGQLGDGTVITRTVPTLVSGGGTWKSVEVAKYATGGYACGIKSDDVLMCWGYNNVGQAGVGTAVNVLVPTPVVWP